MCNKIQKLLVELGHLYLPAIKEWRIILSRYVIAYLEISAFEAYPSLEGNNAFLGLSLTAFHCP
jgi:hypothetical protein